MNEQKIEITFPVVNAVVQYLSTRPYQEVYKLLEVLTAEVKPQLESGEDKVDKSEGA